MKPRNHPLYQAVSSFLKRHLDPKKRVLLALSGGPDSLALYRALLLYREFQPLSLHVAHLDHGWRPNSAKEAEILKQRVVGEGIPYHVRRLEEVPTRNLEDFGRQSRLKFFGELHVRHGFQGVILGHHRDDQAETVLKRMMEGAGLQRLSALRPVTEVEGLPLWRPLLPLPKKKVLDWLELLGEKAFTDETNHDGRFLRGRLRNHVLPQLSREFGKEGSGPLARLGKEAAELSDFMERHLEGLNGAVITTPFGWFLDLQTHPELTPYEIRCLIRLVVDRMKTHLAWDKLDEVVGFIHQNTPKKEIKCGDLTVFVDRRQIWVQKRGERGISEGFEGHVAVEGE